MERVFENIFFRFFILSFVTTTNQIDRLLQKNCLIENVSIGTISTLIGPRQANFVLIAYASSEGSGEPAHARSLARTSAARSYKQ